MTVLCSERRGKLEVREQGGGVGTGEKLFYYYLYRWCLGCHLYGLISRNLKFGREAASLQSPSAHRIIIFRLFLSLGGTDSSVHHPPSPANFTNRFQTTPHTVSAIAIIWPEAKRLSLNLSSTPRSPPP